MTRISIADIRSGEIDLGSRQEPPDDAAGTTGEELCERLPVLSDQHVCQTAGVALAYQEIRTCALGLAGASLLAHLGAASPDELVMMAPSLRARLLMSRDALEPARRSSHRGIATRVKALNRVADILERQVGILMSSRPYDIESAALRAAMNLLNASALYEADMLPFGSASCTESLADDPAGQLILSV